LRVYAGQSIDRNFALIPRRWNGPGRMVVSSAQILKHKGSMILMFIIDGGETTHRWRCPQNWCEQTIKLQLRVAVVFTADSGERRFNNHASRQVGWRIGRVGRGEEDQF